MQVEWDLRQEAPPHAEQTVLLLPGGKCSAGSYAEVMAEPKLANTRLVAARCGATLGRHRQTTTASITMRGSRERLRWRSALTLSSDTAWKAPWLPRWPSWVRLRDRSSCSGSACPPKTSQRSSARSSRWAPCWTACRLLS
jgi:hypothetical protein